MSTRRRQTGPASAAGLISYYEELDSVIKLSPTSVFIFAAAFSLLIILAHLLF
ncbi:MAG: preprotein translocase subunit Sec61beta [Acidilobaceae archaeon]